MSLALLFHYLMLNTCRMLIHPSSGACDLFVELFQVTLKSTPSQYTSILHTKEVLLLEVLNFTLFFPSIFACLSAEHIFDLASKQDKR